MMTATLSDGPHPLATTRFAPKLDALVYTDIRRPQCADWCALRARYYPGPLGSGGITLLLRYYGPMRKSCGLHAPSTLVS
jgi:hypothetical protein